MKTLMVVVALLVAGCESEAPDALEVDAGTVVAVDCGTAADAMVAVATDACVHVEAPLGPEPFTGCTCGDVLRVSAVNPDLVECVAP